MLRLLTHSMDRKNFDEVRKADHVCCEALVLFRWTTYRFSTRQLLPVTKKDVLPSHHQNNVIYQFVCHCDSRYVGRTSQRLEGRIKQHIPKSITNPPTPHIRQSLPALVRTPVADNFTNPPSVNIFLTTPNVPYITRTNSPSSLELALHFISPPWKRLSSNL